jgi:hypothetical protein
MDLISALNECGDGAGDGLCLGQIGVVFQFIQCFPEFRPFGVEIGMHAAAGTA